jgi:two-component system, LuxR family, response regulator FixJ
MMTPTPRPPCVFIVDDDAAVRDSLALLLGLRGFATQSHASAEEFLAALTPAHRGCVLLDLRMPGMSGLEAQVAIAERNPALPVIILTAHGDVAAARTALKAGAFDFIEKPADDALLVRLLSEALASAASREALAARKAALHHRIGRLTMRERQVLEAVVSGHHNREIAAALAISPRTVEVYKARMMDKLQVERIPDLVRLALEAGLPANSSLRGSLTD